MNILSVSPRMIPKRGREVSKCCGAREGRGGCLNSNKTFGCKPVFANTVILYLLVSISPSTHQLTPQQPTSQDEQENQTLDFNVS